MDGLDEGRKGKSTDSKSIVTHLDVVWGINRLNQGERRAEVRNQKPITYAEYPFRVLTSNPSPFRRRIGESRDNILSPKLIHPLHIYQSELSRDGGDTKFVVLV